MAPASLGVTVEDLVAALRTEVQADFAEDGTGHDLTHLDRVYGLAEQLRLREGGDPLILAAASYVHDFHRVVERGAGACMTPASSAL